MKASVRAAFLPFSTRFEGAVSWLYLDILGLVTTSIGVLVDPIAMVRSLPFVRRSDGGRASIAEIEEEWRLVKTHPTAARQGHLALRDVTRLRLTDEGIASVALAKVDLNETILRARFPAFDSWPADAQLAAHSMAWACGPNFHFPGLARALFDADFAAAARECHIDDSHNPGVTPRNAADVALFQNAATVRERGLDADALYWPRELAGEPTPEQFEKPAEIIHPRITIPGPPPREV